MRNTREEYSEVIDEAQALSSVGGNRGLLTEVAGVTLAAWPTLLSDIRKGMARGDLPGVKTAARLAQAAARLVSARWTYEAAHLLETAAGYGDLQATQRASASLEREVWRVQAVLSTLGSFGLPPRG